MSQIISITSEALQATVRKLLPSQQGFGEDLQASNVITPIIDLTPSAEGSEVRADLQTALAFGSQTAFEARNGTVTLANSPGFWRVTGISCITQSSSANSLNKIMLSDGATTKNIWQDFLLNGAAESATTATFDYTIYLDVGEDISVSSGGNNGQISGSYRQIATTDGTLVNPSGFNPQ